MIFIGRSADTVSPVISSNRTNDSPIHQNTGQLYQKQSTRLQPFAERGIAFLIEKVVDLSPHLIESGPPRDVGRPTQAAKELSHIFEGVIESFSNHSDVIVDELVIPVVSGIFFGSVEFAQRGADGVTRGNQCGDFRGDFWQGLEEFVEASGNVLGAFRHSNECHLLFMVGQNSSMAEIRRWGKKSSREGESAKSPRRPVSWEEWRLSDLSMQLDVSVVSTLAGILSADWKGRRKCGGSPDALRAEWEDSASQSRWSLSSLRPVRACVRAWRTIYDLPRWAQGPRDRSRRLLVDGTLVFAVVHVSSQNRPLAQLP